MGKIVGKFQSFQTSKTSIQFNSIDLKKGKRGRKNYLDGN